MHQISREGFCTTVKLAESKFFRNVRVFRTAVVVQTLWTRWRSQAHVYSSTKNFLLWKIEGTNNSDKCAPNCLLISSQNLWRQHQHLDIPSEKLYLILNVSIEVYKSNPVHKNLKRRFFQKLHHKEGCVTNMSDNEGIMFPITGAFLAKGLKHRCTSGFSKIEKTQWNFAVSKKIFLLNYPNSDVNVCAPFLTSKKPC